MVAVTYGVAPTADKAEHKGVFTMMLEAIEAAQMKRAEREIARYSYLMADRTEDEPFGGW